MSCAISGRVSGCLVSLFVSCAGSRALAEEGTRDPDVALSAERAQAVLEERETRARVWHYGWGVAGYGLALTLGTLAATTDDDDAQIAFGFAAGGIVIDTTMHMLTSIEPNAAARAREQPGRASEQLRLVAEAEDRRQSLVFGHLLPAGAATLGNLVLWLGFDNFRGAVAGTLGAIVTNELRILTQPTSAREAWLVHGQGQSPAQASRRVPAATWSLLFTGAGCAVHGTF